MPSVAKSAVLESSVALALSLDLFLFFFNPPIVSSDVIGMLSLVSKAWLTKPELLIKGGKRSH